MTTSFSYWFVLVATVFSCVCCGTKSAASQPDSSPPTLSLRATPQGSVSTEPSEKFVQLDDILVDDDELAYDDYVLLKQHKKARLDYPSEMNAAPLLVEVSYAVLRRSGKVLARFDGVYSGLGNSTRFGLFPFLGGDGKQLIVSQDIFRGGRQWIVSLSPSFRVIHDGGEFDVGREADDMGIADLDQDGVYEITQPVTALYGFSQPLPTGWTPLPTVIFKYDAKAKKYLPANQLFQDYLLKDVNTAKEKMSGPEDRNRHLADVLTITLDYIFAGQEREGWAFYDEAYKLPDKAASKKKIQVVLDEQPVYRFMYRKNGRR